MTKISKSINVLYIANILKKSVQWKIQGYEKSILTPPEDSFTNLCRTLKDNEEQELKMIQYVIDFIKSKNKIQCKHPKIIQDTDPNGIVYCMKCGEDV